jgi:hypothetical protein
MRAASRPEGMMATAPESAGRITELAEIEISRTWGAISQGGGARRPFTHCDSYRLLGMLLSERRPRDLVLSWVFVA